MKPEDFRPITNALNKAFWYGGSACYPWTHPANKIKDCMIIHLDGSPQLKFQVHKNGKLRLRRVFPHSKSYFNFDLKIMQTVTVPELVKMIRLRSEKQYSLVHMRKKFDKIARKS